MRATVWAYGSMPATQPGRPMGHEVLGVVEDLAADVSGFKRGDLVVTVFDRTVGLDQVPDGYRAMADREALKVLIQP